MLLKILEALIEQKQDCHLLGELPTRNIFNNLPISNIKQIHYETDEELKPKHFRAHRRLLFHHSKLKGKQRKEIGKMNLEISTLT